MTENGSKNILITGGAGYIGSHAVLALREAGWGVVVIDDLSTGRRDLVGDDVPFIAGDIGDAALVGQVIRDHGCRSVMHFAGSIIAPESVAEPLKYYANNTMASRNLIEVCVDEGIEAFVFSSTAAVYGNPKKIPIPEEAETKPINPYGSSKLMTEWILRDVAEASPLRYAALRYFNVAGADAEGRSGQAGPNTTHLIRIASEVVAGKRPDISIFGEDYDTPDGTCIRDYIHVSDLADAHVLAIDHVLRTKENLTLNCGYGQGFSVRQVLDVMQKLADAPITVKSAPRREGDAARLVADSKKIRDVLGWRPKHDDLEEIISSALEWERGLVAKE